MAEAGLGLTIGMASQFLVSIPFGRLADRIGARTCWGIGNALQAVAFLGWLFVHGFWPFIAVVVGRTPALYTFEGSRPVAMTAIPGHPRAPLTPAASVSQTESRHAPSATG